MEDETSIALRDIGTALIGIQMVEHLLDLVIHTVFRGESMFSARELERLGKLERHETLGNLIKQLRTKVDVHPELDLYLDRFLEDRNHFVHGLIEIPNFNVSEGEGRQNCLRVCQEMATASVRLTNLFWALIYQFHDRQFQKMSLDDDVRKLFEDANAWAGRVDQFFRIRE